MKERKKERKKERIYWVVALSNYTYLPEVSIALSFAFLFKLFLVFLGVLAIAFSPSSVETLFLLSLQVNDLLTGCRDLSEVLILLKDISWFSHDVVPKLVELL